MKRCGEVNALQSGKRVCHAKEGELGMRVTRSSQGCSDGKCNEEREITYIDAVVNHKVDIMELLHEMNGPWDWDVGVAAAEHGSLACLKYFIKHGGKWHHWAAHAAALNGHTACLQYILEHGCPLMLKSYSLNQLRKYRERFCCTHDPANLVEVVAQRRHYDCVRLLVLHDCKLTRSLTSYLTGPEERGLLQLVVNRGIAVSLDAGVLFSKAGDLEGLKYALEHGCKLSPQLLWVAAVKGHLQCLRYAHQQGCPWIEEVCVQAARGGQLDCLKYAREHGCPWDGRVMVEAEKGGHMDIMEYVDEMNRPTKRTSLTQRK